MEQRNVGGETWGRIVRWIARSWSVASLLLVLAFIAGEGGPSRRIEWIGFLFFPLGICLGMLVAWWKELLGGTITVASLLIFYLIVAAQGVPPKGPWFVAFAAPGFLFLFAWLMSRRHSAPVA